MGALHPRTYTWAPYAFTLGEGQQLLYTRRAQLLPSVSIIFYKLRKEEVARSKNGVGNSPTGSFSPELFHIYFFVLLIIRYV